MKLLEGKHSLGLFFFGSLYMYLAGRSYIFRELLYIFYVNKGILYRNDVIWQVKFMKHYLERDSSLTDYADVFIFIV